MWQRFPLFTLLCCWMMSCATARTQAADPTFDLVIRNGRVVDGTGAPWYRADVAIHNGKIVGIGHIEAEAGKQTIDASDMIVAPGFIDMMGQSASPMMRDPETAINLLTQGITTINAGEGSSAAPLSEEDGKRTGWTTMAEYFALLEMKGLPINAVQSVGHTQVRSIVMGDTDRRPSDEELERMRALVREGMEAGAIGVSTALIYPPATYASTQEISELAKEAGKYGGRYFTHMRNEGDRLLEAIDEALDIGRTADVPVHIFHLKTAGRQNWGKMPAAIAKIREARVSGLQVAADIYPYVNNGLGITALIHPRHFASGQAKWLERIDEPALRAEIRREMESTDGWENWYRHVGLNWDRIILGTTSSAKYRGHRGKSIAAIAELSHEDVWDTFFSLAKSDTFVLPQSMSEANKILAMQQDFVSFCTDVGPAGGDSIAAHPRAYGAFPRIFARYIRELGVITLERAVAAASSQAANELGIYDRGRITIGSAADIVIFDLKKIQDNATFENPAALSTGVSHVLVNGQIVLSDGKQTSSLPGKVLRGPGYQRNSAPAAVSTGKTSAEFRHFDETMSTFMEKNHVPGGAVAVSEDGRIAFARGYGLADIAKREPVTSTSLFRIASISKPITAVAILKLAEQGKLKLDDKVLDHLAMNEAVEAAGKDFDPRWRDITLRHLLQHRGGWDRDKSFDAMFQSVRFAHKFHAQPPASPHVVIQSMLAEKLDFVPGERYAYSNFGYCLLGRVIERLSGRSYEQFVQDEVLRPIGIQSMRLGHTRLEDRVAGEVRYYQPGNGSSVFASDLEQDVPRPYGSWYLEAMDAHGGWLASAEDLIRFASAFDDLDKCPILNRKSIEEMFQRPDGAAGYEADGAKKEVYYSLGWMNREVGGGRVNHWHTGSLDGTATILIRRHDRRNMAGLLNTRSSTASPHLGRELDQIMHVAADELSRKAE